MVVSSSMVQGASPSDDTNSPRSRAGTVVRPSSSTVAGTTTVIVRSRFVAVTRRPVVGRLEQDIAEHRQRRPGRHRPRDEPQGAAECRGRDGGSSWTCSSLEAAFVTRLSEYDLQSLEISRRCSSGDTGDNRANRSHRGHPRPARRCAQAASVVHRLSTGCRGCPQMSTSSPRSRQQGCQRLCRCSRMARTSPWRRTSSRISSVIFSMACSAVV